MRRSSKVIFILGCLLVALSLVMLILSQVQIRQAKRTNIEIVQTMETILTDRREGIKDVEQETTDMPVLELKGEDFVALLEIPSFGIKLPVCGDWDKGKAVSYPCRFCGSVYNGTLVIGGYDQPGQFDFFDRISNGSIVTVTDMTGREFSYVVERVERSGSAQEEVLIDDGADLTLFVRDAQLLEYIILRCVTK